MIEVMGGMGGHVTKTLPMAQAIKDATMAYNIAGQSGNGKLFIHFNGSYHSDNFESILWYLNIYRPGLSIVTISSVEQKDLDSLNEESLKKANYIIAISESMTKTY